MSSILATQLPPWYVPEHCDGCDELQTKRANLNFHYRNAVVVGSVDAFFCRQIEKDAPCVLSEDELNVQA